MSLERFIEDFSGKSLFLPSHGRGEALPSILKKLLNGKPGHWDLPELPEFGGPLITDGAVARSQERSALDIGADRCWYGVNGATGLLQAALLAMANPGQFVLMPRNVHRSLIQACVLGDLIPVLFDLPFAVDRGHYLPPDGNWFEIIFNQIEKKGLDLAAVVLVNPTYHGYSTNLSLIIEQIHKRDLPVLVDEAHGTYFGAGLGLNLPHSALAAESDLVVNSLHKSALGLTQTAVLWSKGSRVDSFAIEKSLMLFQTTSPNSLFLASCEASLREFSSISGKKKLKERIESARGIRTNLIKAGFPLLENQDPLRLIFHTATLGISGFEADSFLMSLGLVAELPESGCLTFCLGFSSHKGLQRMLQRSFQKLVKHYEFRKKMSLFSPPPLSLIMIPDESVRDCWKAKSKIVPLLDAVGEISSDFVCPYPPGIPLVIPGERLDNQRISWLLEQKSFSSSQIPSEIKVVY